MSHPFDLFAYLLIIILSIVGYKRGLFKEISRPVGILLSLLIAKNLSSFAVGKVQPFINIDSSFIAFVSFLSIFLASVAAIRFITNTIQVFFLSTGIKIINRLLGLAFGTFKGVLAILLIVWLIDITNSSNYFPDFENHSTFKQTYSGLRIKIIQYIEWEEVVIKNEVQIREKLSFNKKQYFSKGSCG